MRRQDHAATDTCGFMVAEPDQAWQHCVVAPQAGRMSSDLALPTPVPSLPLQQGKAAHAVVTRDRCPPVCIGVPGLRCNNQQAM